VGEWIVVLFLDFFGGVVWFVLVVVDLGAFGVGLGRGVCECVISISINLNE
jgi:hypothetical protein